MRLTVLTKIETDDTGPYGLLRASSVVSAGKLIDALGLAKEESWTILTRKGDILHLPARVC
jgi:hypothetical protein